MKQLTRQQLQNDLAAAVKKHSNVEWERDRLTGQLNDFRLENKKLTEERDDWRFAFRTICKLVGK